MQCVVNSLILFTNCACGHIIVISLVRRRWGVLGVVFLCVCVCNALSWGLIFVRPWVKKHRISPGISVQFWCIFIHSHCWCRIGFGFSDRFCVIRFFRAVSDGRVVLLQYSRILAINVGGAVIVVCSDGGGNRLDQVRFLFLLLLGSVSGQTVRRLLSYVWWQSERYAY